MDNPLKKIVGWVRDLFYKNNRDVIGEVALSDEMQSAITDWLNVLYVDQRGKKSHSANFAEVVTDLMASLATNEITVSVGKGKRADFIESQINTHVLSQIKPAVQLAAAGGYAVLKPYIVGKEIQCDLINANHFLPVRYLGRQVVEGIFLDEATVGKEKYYKIERHSLKDMEYTITHEVFSESMQKASLSNVPEWANIRPETVIQNIERPLFGVLRTAKINTIDGSKNPVSVYSVAMETLKRIDIILNHLEWEIESGRRKQILDATAVDFSQEENGRVKAAYPPDQYLLLNTGDVSKPFDDYTPDMRIEAYQKALDTQLRILEMQTGLSVGTLNVEISRSGVKTATEIIAQDKTTYNTIKAFQENGLRQGLKDIVYAYNIYATLGDLAPLSDIDPIVDFGDSIFEDTATEFERRFKMVTSKILKPEQLLAYYFNREPDDVEDLLEMRSTNLEEETTGMQEDLKEEQELEKSHEKEEKSKEEEKDKVEDKEKERR